jgi:UDP-N-acetylglucosamine 1-carboxyvinyltransferase
VAGAYRVQGSKLAAIAILAATPAVPRPLVLRGVPRLLDTQLMVDFLRSHGADASWSSDRELMIDTRSMRPPDVLAGPVVDQIHGSVHLVSGLLARFGAVSFTDQFGGCRIGDRSTRWLIDALQQFGAQAHVDDDRTHLTLPDRHAATFAAPVEHHLDRFQSARTKAALILGTTMGATTVVDAPYRRTSTVALADFLVSAGGKLERFDDAQLRISGTHGAEDHPLAVEVPGDELDALTALSLLAIRGGELEVVGFDPRQCEPELRLLSSFGVEIASRSGGVHATRRGPLKSCSFSTAEIDTDAQPMLAAINLFADGEATVTETVWTERFSWAQEAARLGADMEEDERRLTIRGGAPLHAGVVEAGDLRAAAALIAVASAVPGTTEVRGVSHLDRGYDDLPSRYRAIGVEL